MEANQAQPTDDQQQSRLSHILDALPFMFAAIVVVFVLLAVMSPAIGNIYSNIVSGL